MPPNETQTAIDRIEKLDVRTAANRTALSFLKWLCGIGLPVFLIIAATAYAKAERAGGEAQVRSAQQEERYKQIQKDLAALDKKIDERFAQIRDTLNEMKGPK